MGPTAWNNWEPSEPELTRASPDEKDAQIGALRAFQQAHAQHTGAALAELQRAAVDGDNLFAALMEAVQVASLGQITRALYAVGGEYRRNL